MGPGGRSLIGERVSDSPRLDSAITPPRATLTLHLNPNRKQDMNSKDKEFDGTAKPSRKSKGRKKARKRAGHGSVEGLPEVRPKVAGIDLASREHHVCAPVPGGGREIRVFGTTTRRLRQLVNWLKDCGIESAAMESTGVYWIPLFGMLEEAGIEPVLGNARELKSVPGRKSDVADCEWIQRLHACGLVRASFRPAASVCRCRTLLRQRGNLAAEQTRAVQWMQKSLDQMNVCVHHAVSDITGKTGMAIIRAIVEGERNPAALADLRDTRCKKSVEEIAEHLEGTWSEEHLFNLARTLRHYEHLAEELAAYDERISAELLEMTPPERREASVPPHANPGKERAIRNRGEAGDRTAFWRLCGSDLTRIDGISSRTARTVLCEVGFDLSAFPTEKHFVSWLRLCPRMNSSGGKSFRRKKPNGMGAGRVAATFRMAASSLRSSKTALGAQYRRIAYRNGSSVAVFAIARRLAVLVYRMLRWGQDYVDEGLEAYEARHEEKRIKGISKAAKAMGYVLVPCNATVEVSG